MANFDPKAPGTAKLVTNRYDFQAHVDGEGFRHTADMMDMNPSLIPGATTVQSTLNSFNDTINLLESVGQGFITIGDGYDTWNGPSSTTISPFDPTVPSIDTILNPIFTAIYNGTPLPAAFVRIQNGGIVVIKAGTYIVRKTILVPPGITLMGEGFGTKIINATNLTATEPPTQGAGYSITSATNTTPINITTSTIVPNLANGDIVTVFGVTGNTAANTIQYQWIAGNVVNSGGHTSFDLTYGFNGIGSAGAISSVGNGVGTTGTVLPIKPMFMILPTGYTTLPGLGYPRTYDDGIISGNSNQFAFIREVKITNMVIGDNFIEPPHVPDANYTIAQNYTSGTLLNTPGLIQQEAGSSFVLSNVMLVGRANSGLTASALYLDNAIPAASTLSVSNCTMDGFSIPIIWLGTSGGNDYVQITDSKLRAHGNYAGFGTDGNNSIILVNDSTTDVSGNILYGNGLNIHSAVYVNGVASSPPTLQARGKLIVSNNDIIISKSTNAPVTTFYPILVNTPVTSTYLTWMEYGNKSGTNLFQVTIEGTGATPATNMTVGAGGSTMTNLTLSGTLSVVGTATMGTANITTANVGGAATIGSTLTIGGATIVNGTFTANNSSLFSGTATFSNNTTLNGKIFINTNPLISTNYTVDSGGIKDYVVIVPTTAGACVVKLPPASANLGRMLIVKDIGAASLTNTITIETQIGDQFESTLTRTPVGGSGYTDSIVIITPFTSITLVAANNSTPGWYLI